MDWTCLQDVQIKNTKENLGLEAAGYVDGRGDELLKTDRHRRIEKTSIKPENLMEKT